AYRELTAGISELDFDAEAQPSRLLLTLPHAFPVAVNSSDQVLIAASTLGSGRMVVLSHETYLSSPKFHHFLLNSIAWLSSSPAQGLGVIDEPSELSEEEENNEVEVEEKRKETHGSISVLCTDAYAARDWGALERFVRRGGGLLVGGQAWYWTTVNGNPADPLDGFPGNRVMGAAGILVSRDTAEKGPVMVSDEVPEAAILYSYKPCYGADYEQIAAAIDCAEIALGTECPSQVVAHGSMAFPLLVDGEGRAVVGASRHGAGRVVVFGHETIAATRPSARPALASALAWLAGGDAPPPSTGLAMVGTVGIRAGSHLAGLKETLTNLGVPRVVEFDSFPRVEAIREFVAQGGGGLLVAGQAWWWSSSRPGMSAVDLYPGNRIINSMGLTITAVACGEGRLLLSGRPLQTVPALDCPRSTAPISLRLGLRDFACHLTKKSQLSGPRLTNLVSLLRRDLVPLLGSRDPAFRPLRAIVWDLLRGPLWPDLAAVGPESLGDIFPGRPLEPTYRGWQEVTIDVSSKEGLTWVSTGLYAPPAQRVLLDLPSLALGRGIQIQLGCHTDQLYDSKTMKRHPEVTRSMPVVRGEMDRGAMEVASSWGGLLYLLVPEGVSLGKIRVRVRGAARAPYFKLGETSLQHWQEFERHYPAPWSELACDSLILTVPSEAARGLADPERLMRLWDRMTGAIAYLAAEPHPSARPERIVVDEQISHGWMHAGYPIMVHRASIPKLLNEQEMRAEGMWGPLHELGHNRQRPAWNFPPHTTEATNNLFAVYVHEEVLGVARARAHPDLRPAERERRLRDHVDAGCPLAAWTVFTCLETYLQLQEAFGWDPFVRLFGDYQRAASTPSTMEAKMSEWAERFSRCVGRNLAPFFSAWGW
uniref:Peptidase M60 domain-containing protein n=1 Tax=Petromyzon marinus TaxID=7757 RepID=S4R6Z2_PETMA